MINSEQKGAMGLPGSARDFNGAGEVLLVDKPLDWTSFDVVRRVSVALGIKKAGHAGTLDPKATGLMILCTGKKTKSLNQFVGLDKEYVGKFELGVRTPSFDSETEVMERSDYSSVTLETLRSVAKVFVGRQLQKPPMYSAAKHHGKPLYKYARKGKTLERASKEIEISEFEICSFTPPLVEFRVACSKGTYIRSLVDDVGTALGCGASLRSLRRTRIGPFRIGDAFTMQQLESIKQEFARSRQENHESCLPT